MTGSDRIVEAFRRTREQAPEGARLVEHGHVLIYYVGNRPVALWHKNKNVATFSWMVPKGKDDHEQVHLSVMPCALPDFQDTLLWTLWGAIYRLDISTLTESPPSPYPG